MLFCFQILCIWGTLHRLKRAPRKINIGIGKDSVGLISRGIEGRRKPILIGGPWGCPVSEEFYSEIHYSFAKEAKVDILSTGYLRSFKGMEIKKGSPIEMAAARAEALMARDAVRRANRPGMGMLGVASAITIAALSFADFPEGFRLTDLHEIAQLNELKMMHTSKMVDTQFDDAYLQNGYMIEVAQCPILGSVGGPEETAIVATAEAIQGFVEY